MNLSLSPKPTATAHVPSYSLFAQLLAGERLTVRVDANLKTAAFSPDSRVLMLPSWSGFSNESWLLFIAHEVGHALYTPADSLTTHPEWLRLTKAHGLAVVKNVINVFEDIRIERLVRNKYRGLSGVFGRGYHSLLSQKFFGFEAAELSDAVWANKQVLDRINLYAKVGTLVRRSLSTSQEIAWYNRALKADTFEEVLTLVEEVILALTEEQKKNLKQEQAGQQSKSNQPSQKNLPLDGQPSNSPQDASQNGQSQDDQSSSESQNDAADGSPAQNGQPSQSDQSAQESKESQNGQSSSESQNDKSSTDSKDSSPSQNGQSSSNQPTEGQDFGSDPFAIPSQESATAAMYTAAIAGRSRTDVILPVDTKYLHYNDITVEEMLAEWKAPTDIRAALHQAVLSQRREQSPILASMIASFRANQSAWLARRVQVSRTGAIDTSKLAQYKLTEDLFLRRRSLPEAQNHGFVIHVDWSGSMDGKLATVLWQVLHLIWFAESIKVPVSVYGFSNSGNATPAFLAHRLLVATPGYRRGDGRLLELYRSNTSAAIKQEAQTFLFALALRFAGFGPAVRSWTTNTEPLATAPRSMRAVATKLIPIVEAKTDEEQRATFFHPYVSLGGTPLYHALFASIDTVRKFRQTHRIEQCISVWLTDGHDTDALNTVDGTIIPTAAPSMRGDRYGIGQFGTDSFAARLIDPRSGRAFVVETGRTLATMFDVHRALTGATVVCVDITSTPMDSLRRVLSKTELSIAANLLGDEYANTWCSRRRGGRIKAKVIVQTRKRVVMPTSGDGDFSSTGLLLVTRKQYPRIGCDAYLVSHPDWWVNSEVGTKSIKTAAADVLSRSNSSFDPEDDADETLTEDEMRQWAIDERRTPVRLNAALLEQHATVAMRRFAAILVPYMAVGRDDASV